MTLTEFLLARIAEDEAAALLVHNQHGSNPEPMGGYEWMSEYDLLYVPPVRVLAECAAKRAIVEEAVAFDGEESSGLSGDWARSAKTTLRDVARHLAAVYAEHPDYRNEWRL